MIVRIEMRAVAWVALTLALCPGCGESDLPTSAPAADAPVATAEDAATTVEAGAPVIADEKSALPSVASSEKTETTAAAATAPTEGIASESTTAKSDGVWIIESATLAGAPFPPHIASQITLTLEGDAYTVLVGTEPDKGTCKTDTSTTPHQMTITGTEGPNAGKTMLAICDYPSDTTMRVCYDMTGTAFPQSFASTVENKLYSVVYVRKP